MLSKPNSRPISSLRPPRSLQYSLPPIAPLDMTSTTVAFQRSKLSSTSSPRAAPKSECGASVEAVSPREPPRLVFFDTATGQSVGQSGHATDSLATGVSGGKLDMKGSVSVRGTRKEEFEYLEGIISNPRLAGSRNETEKLDGHEARRECFRACASLCVAMRMPCSETVSQELTELPYGGSRKRGGTAVMADSSGVRTVIREYASEQRIRAIKQALWKVLRKPKPAEAAPKSSWRDKFREDDGEVDDLAGFMVKDPSEHSPWVKDRSENSTREPRPQQRRSAHGHSRCAAALSASRPQVPKSQWKKPPMSALLDSPELTPAPSRLPSKAGRRGSMSGAVSKGDTSKGRDRPREG